eukprot:753641-Hanusia_phi.AAC.1
MKGTGNTKTNPKHLPVRCDQVTEPLTVLDSARPVKPGWHQLPKYTGPVVKHRKIWPCHEARMKRLMFIVANLNLGAWLEWSTVT